MAKLRMELIRLIRRALMLTSSNIEMLGRVKVEAELAEDVRRELADLGQAAGEARAKLDRDLEQQGIDPTGLF